MCKYCNPEGDVNVYKNRDDGYPSRDIYIYLHSDKLTVETYSSDGHNYVDAVPVNYCPMCGRELH